MTLILKQIFALMRLLHSETGEKQIASGIALGVILGFSPFLSLQSLLVIFILLFTRAQIGAAFLSAFFFSFIAYLIDPMAHVFGGLILGSPGLKELWTTLYNMPIVPLTKFNNTVVMGSGIIGLLLAPIAYLSSQVLIQRYRTTVVKRIGETRVAKMIKKTSVYNWYVKYEELY